MSEQVKEIRGQFSDTMVITELRGAYPNVPIWSDVDYAALTDGDANPVFLTIPLGKANITSGNKRFYDEAWLQELERQTVALKPIGIMGHLSEAQRATEFPPEAVHWVGVVREGDTLWGKGYIPPGEARGRIQRYKAQGRSIATSIDAYAGGTWDDKLGAFHMKANTMKLGQIDIAPLDRAGIPSLASVPVLSTEMVEAPVVIVDKPTEVKVEKDKLTIIQELTADEARLLPEPVRAAVLATVQIAPEVATVATVREVLGLDAKTDIVSAVTEMRRIQTEQAKAAVTSKITELVTAGIKLEDVRTDVTEMIVARNPQTVQQAEDAYKAVVEMPIVKKLLGARVVETMGPPQRTQVQGQDKGGKYFVIPKSE